MYYPLVLLRALLAVVASFGGSWGCEVDIWGTQGGTIWDEEALKRRCRSRRGTAWGDRDNREHLLIL